MLNVNTESLSNEYIKKYELKEVKSPILFLRPNEPDPEGLASYEIFDMPGSENRKKIYAYIKLNDLFVHPHYYLTLKFIKRQFVDLIRGEATFYLDDGTIHKLKENETPPSKKLSGTGPKFLWKIWDKLDFSYKNLKSGMRRDRMRFLNTVKKRDVFVDKWIVMPPFYRDIDVSNNKKNAYNTFYIKLINLASTIDETNEFMGKGTINTPPTPIHLKLMDTLLDHYNEIMTFIPGRKGFIHKNIMGKNLDYGGGLVINSLAIRKIKDLDEMHVLFERSSVPLYALIKCFAPFIIFEVRRIISDVIGFTKFIWYKEKKGGNYKRYELDENWRTLLTSDYINGLIDLYDKSYHHRLDPVTIMTKEGVEVPISYISFDGDENVKFSLNPEDFGKESEQYIQPIRLIHLFYMAFKRMKERHIDITRFPIEGYNSMYPSKIWCNPYYRTKKVTVNGEFYENFPIVYESDLKNISVYFNDSLVIHPSMLSAIGGDFDGDRISISGRFTKQANEEAHNLIYSLKHLTDLDGNTSRNIGILAEHIIYNFTYA